METIPPLPDAGAALPFVGRDAARFLGVRGEPDAPLRARIAEMADRVRAAADPRETHRIFPARADRATGAVRLGAAWALQSRSLAGALARCGEAWVFVATLGAGVDRFIRTLQARSAAEAALAQAVAAELADTWCDTVCARLAAAPETAGRALRPRFSPGYGDCPLDAQRALFAALDVPRRIGVSLTDALLMVPTKTVSAFVGVAESAPRA